MEQTAKKYRGVYKDRNRWRAVISIGARGAQARTSLGRFASARDAAEAYDKAARKWFGKSAALNFPEESKKAKRSAP